MSNKILFYCFPATLLTLGNTIVLSSAKAQITTDGTTNTNLTTTPNGVRIDNGNQAGGNLFHSFREFSVPTNTEAFFNNNAEVVNIFSRVTGGNISNIEGLIRANGRANLFLINPAGILFGNNSSLQIGGSFYGSTADSILFPNGVEFSAINPQTPILTINAPIGLNFRDNPGQIVNSSFALNSVGNDLVGLEVAPGNTLGLVGGNISFETGQATANSGRIELGGLADAGTVTFNDDGSLNFPEDVAKADITFSNFADLDVTGTGKGSIAINGRNISLSGSSQIRAGITTNLTSTEIQTGDITINATDNITVNQSLISNGVDLGAVGDAGDINITAKSLNIINQAAIDASTFGEGDAGNITVDASEAITLTDDNTEPFDTLINTGAFNNANGNAGNINLNTGSLTLNSAALTTPSLTNSNSGNVTINATEIVALDNSSVIFTLANGVGNAGDIDITAESLNITNQSNLDASTSGQGNAGNIDIAVQSLNLTNQAELDASTFGLGNGGNITVNASEAITLTDNNTDFSDTLINAGAFNSDSGNAGNINLNTGSLTLNSSSLIAFSLTNSSAGNITINADNAENEISLLNNSRISVLGADGGSITIEGKNLEITSGSELIGGINADSSSTEAQAGDIIINLTEDLLIDGIGSNGSTNISHQNLGTGNTGNIVITARNIDFRNGGNIFNSNQGVGNLGNVTIVAKEDISFDGIQGISRSGISNFVNPGATGDVGKIEIQAQNLSISNGGQLSSIVGGTGNIGNINLNVADTIVVDGMGELTSEDGTTIIFPSQIDSNVGSSGTGSFGVGNSANININTQNLFLSRNGEVNASIFGVGNAGDININADVITLGGQGDINLSSSSISSEAISGILNLPLLEANAGDITINTRSLSISDGGNIDTSVRAIGNGGNININATESISVDGTGIFQNPLDQTNIETRSAIRASTSDNAVGNGGSIEINTGNFSLTNQGLINTSSIGQGNAGNITINATDSFVATNDSLITSNIGSPIETPARGILGNITISSRDISFSNTSQIQAGALSNATATQPGIISLTATEKISFTGTNTEITNTGIFSSNDLSSLGDASSVRLSAPNILLNNNAVITTGNAGNGQGGDITIEADILTLNASAIITSNEGQGDAGNIVVNANNNLFARNNSFILSNIGSPRETPAVGRVGNITISSRDIAFSDTSQIQAGAFSNATATQPGTVSLSATEKISFTGTDTGIFSNNDSGSLGDASNVSLSAPNIVLINGAVITASNGADSQTDDVIQGGDVTIKGDVLTLNASGITTNTSGIANAGEININLTNSLELNESSLIRAEVLEGATGNGGEVVIKTPQIVVNEGSQISTSTNGEGNAGELSIHATDSIQLDGSTATQRSGFLATATIGSGNGGNITVTTDELKITNGATIAASNFQSRGLVTPGTGEAGNLIIKANSITLDNDATIDAATRSGEGGTIRLQVADSIKLQNNSQISAEALEDANGGNVNINAKFILAFPSSGNGNDIIANAERGDGGEINITAESILGISERQATLGNGTNDIDASSQFGLSGDVTFSVPDTNNFQEIANSSLDVISAEAIAYNACSNNTGQSGLILQGKGGVPQAPNSTLDGQVLLGNQKPNTLNNSQLHKPKTTQIQPVKTTQGDIYPARGVIVKEDGTVTLTAYTTNQLNPRIPSTTSCNSNSTQRDLVRKDSPFSLF